MLRPHLKTFLAVCETGSFNKAANNLYITPSAVLQQIQTLEAELNVTLFIRGKKGVTLTPEGEYLLQKGKTLNQLNDEIHREIKLAGSAERTIYIGTSIMEKCRLLYDLWVLFSANDTNCEIQMLNIDAWHRIPERTDLIESVHGNVDWVKEWEFYEICKVPFGFAVANNHPLAGKKVITCDDLIFEIAKNVYGWGRVHACWFLEPETREIKQWFLTEGVDNGVMPPYTALMAWLCSSASGPDCRGG